MTTFFGMLRDGYGLSLIALGFILAMVCDAARRIWTASVPDFEEQPHEKADERFAATAHDELHVCTLLTVAIALVAAAALFAGFF